MNSVMAYHDDWMVNVLLDNGAIYAFNTEMWPEHGADTDTDWPRVVRAAIRSAFDLAERNVTPFCVVSNLKGFTLPDMHAAIDSACDAMDDATFHARINR